MKRSHESYLNESLDIPFPLSNLHKEDLLFLIKYGAWMEALLKKYIDPETAEQKKFIEEVNQTNGTNSAKSKYTKIWKNYLYQINLQTKEQDQEEQRKLKACEEEQNQQIKQKLIAREELDRSMRIQARYRSEISEFNDFFESNPDCRNLFENRKSEKAQQIIDDKVALAKIETGDDTKPNIEMKSAYERKIERESLEIKRKRALGHSGNYTVRYVDEWGVYHNE